MNVLPRPPDDFARRVALAERDGDQQAFAALTAEFQGRLVRR